MAELDFTNALGADDWQREWRRMIPECMPAKDLPNWGLAFDSRLRSVLSHDSDGHFNMNDHSAQSMDSSLTRYK